MDIDRIGFVKIDVEGHETQVLAGMSETLHLVGTILVEMHGFSSEEDRQAVVETLSTHFNTGWSLLEGRRLNSIDMESTEDVLQLLCSKNTQDLRVFEESLSFLCRPCGPKTLNDPSLTAASARDNDAAYSALLKMEGGDRITP